MPKYNHHFLPLDPPVARDQLANVKPLCEALIKTTSGYELVVRLLGRPHTVDVIAVSIPEDAPDEPRTRWLRLAFEHMLTALRLTYDHAADVARPGGQMLNAMNQTDDPIPVDGLAIIETLNEQHVVDVKNLVAVFHETSKPEIATPIALIAEGQLPTMPPHYRALSLIRALELMFEKRPMRDWYDKYEEKFAALDVSRQKLKNAIHDIRTRCAHGVSRGGSPPFTGVGFANEDKLQEVVSLLRTITTDAAREIYKLNIGPKNKDGSQRLASTS
jgi:hypothetical protein